MKVRRRPAAASSWRGDAGLRWSQGWVAARAGAAIGAGEDLFHGLEGGAIAQQRPPPPGVERPVSQARHDPQAPGGARHRRGAADRRPAGRPARPGGGSAAASPLTPRPPPPARPSRLRRTRTPTGSWTSRTPAAAGATADRPPPNASRAAAPRPRRIPTWPRSRRCRPRSPPARSLAGRRSAPVRWAWGPAGPAPTGWRPDPGPSPPRRPLVPTAAASAPGRPLPRPPQSCWTGCCPTVVPPPATPLSPRGQRACGGFTPGSAQLPPSATLNLRRFALAHKGVPLTITGHGGRRCPAPMRKPGARPRLAPRPGDRRVARHAGVPAANLHLHAEAAGQGGSVGL